MSTDVNPTGQTGAGTGTLSGDLAQRMAKRRASIAHARAWLDTLPQSKRDDLQAGYDTANVEALAILRASR